MSVSLWDTGQLRSVCVTCIWNGDETTAGFGWAGRCPPYRRPGGWGGAMCGRGARTTLMNGRATGGKSAVGAKKPPETRKGELCTAVDPGEPRPTSARRSTTLHAPVAALRIEPVNDEAALLFLDHREHVLVIVYWPGPIESRDREAPGVREANGQLPRSHQQPESRGRNGTATPRPESGGRLARGSQGRRTWGARHETDLHVHPPRSPGTHRQSSARPG